MKLLFICGSRNQTTQMHQVADHLQDDFDCYFTPYYADGLLHFMAKKRLLEYTVLGSVFQEQNLSYFRDHGLRADPRGEKHDYDLVFTCTDLIVQKNIRRKKIILIQEGLTVPDNWRYHAVRALKLNRALANTSMTGLSHAYTRFCVAGSGYRTFFERRGVDPSKLVVTGIPNFDDLGKYRENDFPHHNYVLSATSRLRETMQPEDRKGFIRRSLEIADGRQLIFKLHPYEQHTRAIREIRNQTADALIYSSGSTEEMIANCEAMITRYSTVILTALGLDRKVYSDYDAHELEYFKPLQNGGRSAEAIANVAREVLEGGNAHS